MAVKLYIKFAANEEVFNSTLRGGGRRGKRMKLSKLPRINNIKKWKVYINNNGGGGLESGETWERGGEFHSRLHYYLMKGDPAAAILCFNFKKISEEVVFLTRSPFRSPNRPPLLGFSLVGVVCYYCLARFVFSIIRSSRQKLELGEGIGEGRGRALGVEVPILRIMFTWISSRAS